MQLSANQRCSQLFYKTNFAFILFSDIIVTDTASRLKTLTAAYKFQV